MVVSPLIFGTADGGKLGHSLCQFSLRASQFKFRTGFVAHFFFGTPTGFTDAFFIELFGAFGVIGKDDGLSLLYFDKAARNVDDFFFAVRQGQADLSCFEDGKKRSVAGEDAQLAALGGPDTARRRPPA